MIGQNLQYLRKKYGLSQQALSDILEIPRTTLGDYERSKTEPNIAMLLKIAHHFDIKLEDLLDSDLSLEQYMVADDDKLKVLAITVNDENEGNIELVESKAEAGYLDSFQNPEYLKELPRLRLPNLEASSYRAFEISGDSMLPIESGSIVICSYVENIQHIKEGKSYVIISQKEGMVYKRVRFDGDNKRLILISDNTLYLPYSIQFEDIDEIWQYHAHLSFNDKRISDMDSFEYKLNDMHHKLNDIHQKLNNQ